MSALLAWFLTNPSILAIGAGLVGALGWGFRQRLAGARAERSKQANAEAAARDVADQVDYDVGALPADAVRKELKSWARD
ncbi:ABC transporter permease [Mesorhizobium sp. CA18]|uniref:ABC transporter permease n=1 Tax=unclassified Mesorhizobium TaxID=325217 RepID=UPI001CCC5BAF|nr:MULTISPECIES: ABC transporter permease [unclassified Mesorhizobium]MBZ9736115.1 ABC transporter permease [Mesorhizobium sp. CA9]MBZ9827879.1 ABC transporter permease [Mesorhizobium sp. CA18]MBZ9833685.1 ABC transporter permease [Mesorhizobium sp. CA2]MBZ9839898.1 ABC transporter permease [Mesorhizobium sp. CA3]MBZ9879968.1 ABC transporter permease [Mesorhizobium sp. Ca11]